MRPRLGVAMLLLGANLAFAASLYRVTLRDGTAVLSSDLPVRQGTVYVFHRLPDKKLTGIPIEQVLEIVEINEPSSAPAIRRAEPAPAAAATPAVPAVKAHPAPAPTPKPVRPAPTPRSGPAPAAASAPPPTPAPAVPEPATQFSRSVSLQDAVRTTLEYAPAVLGAREEANLRRGVLQSATGQFDTSVFVAPSYSRLVGVLLSGEIRSEVQKRELFSIPADALEELADNLQDSLDEGDGNVSPVVDPCPNLTITDQSGKTSAPCLDPRSDNGANAQAFEDIRLGIIANDENVQNRIGAQNIQDSLNSTYTALFEDFISKANSAVDQLRAVVRDLGPLPRSAQIETLGLDLQVLFPFRNGLVAGPLIAFQGIDNNFVDKSQNPRFGGKAIPTIYNTTLGLLMAMPLARGSGTAAVAATENAARFDFEGSLETLAQTGSQSALDTVLAYWSLVASQERLAILERSLASQKRISEVSEALVQADEIAAAEMGLIRARVADVRAATAQARVAVVAARVALAQAMGLKIEDLDGAALAADPLPDPDDSARLEALPLDRLAEEAVRDRSDLKALSSITSASEVLETAARINLRPALNLTLQVDFRSFFENAPSPPAETSDYKGAYWLTGYRSAVLGRWTGPNVRLGLTLQLPFRNNAARGQLAQAEAVREQSIIQQKDLGRVIRSQVFQLVRDVQIAAKEVRVRKGSVEYYGRTIDAAFSQYRAGELSLLDAILTERDQTQALLDLLVARLVYASSVAQLRFQTGSLVRYTRSAEDVVFGNVEPLGFQFDTSP